jgi:predicted DsbA family dithiol-disulfide isomerase
MFLLTWKLGVQRTANSGRNRMRVDIWSDIVCPWCYIGNSRFSRALADFEHRDDVEVVPRSFELDPSIPEGQATPILDLLASKYGMSPAQAQQAEARVAALAEAEGLDFTVDRAMGNTFDAHRLVHLGGEHGAAERVAQRLYHAYFGEGRSVFDREALVGVAADAGLDPDGARQALENGSYGDEVRGDEDQARRLGITGVPFCVLDGKFGVSGAQPEETFAQALRQAWDSQGGG